MKRIILSKEHDVIITRSISLVYTTKGYPFHMESDERFVLSIVGNMERLYSILGWKRIA